MSRSDRKSMAWAWGLSIIPFITVWVLLVNGLSLPLFKLFYPRFWLNPADRPSQNVQYAWLFVITPIFAALITWGLIRGLVGLVELPEKRRMAREQERKRAQAEADREARRKADVARHELEQRQLATRLDNLISQSAAVACELPNLIAAAEKSLDLANDEFEEQAFVPFWDAVEAATTKLATIEHNVQRLIQNSQFHEQEARKLETPVPRFQIGVETLPDASRTVHKLRTVVRRAQKDPDFTKIYLMYRQNKLLVAGFSTLGDALNEIGNRLDLSFDRLASSINVGIAGLAAEITSSHDRMTATLAGASERSREQNAIDAKSARNEASKHARKRDEKLDNIQRRKYPRPHRIGDGEY